MRTVGPEGIRSYLQFLSRSVDIGREGDIHTAHSERQCERAETWRLMTMEMWGSMGAMGALSSVVRGWWTPSSCSASLQVIHMSLYYDHDQDITVWNLLSALAGLTFFLQQQVVMFINGGRRFGPSEDEPLETYFNQISNLLDVNDVLEVGTWNDVIYFKPTTMHL